MKYGQYAPISSDVTLLSNDGNEAEGYSDAA